MSASAKKYNLAIELKQYKQHQKINSNSNKPCNSMQNGSPRMLQKIIDVQIQSQQADQSQNFQESSIHHTSPQPITNIFTTSSSSPKQITKLNDLLLQQKSYNIVGLKQVKAYKNKSKKRKYQPHNNKRTQSFLSLSRISVSVKSLSHENVILYNKDQLVTIVMDKYYKQRNIKKISSKQNNHNKQNDQHNYKQKENNNNNNKNNNNKQNEFTTVRSHTNNNNKKTTKTSHNNSTIISTDNLNTSHNANPINNPKQSLFTHSTQLLHYYQKTWQISKSKKQLFPSILQHISTYRQKVQFLQKQTLLQKKHHIHPQNWINTLRNKDKNMINYYDDKFVTKIIKQHQCNQNINNNNNNNNNTTKNDDNNNTKNDHNNDNKMMIKVKGKQKIFKQIEWAEDKDKNGYVFKFIDNNNNRMNNNTNINNINRSNRSNTNNNLNYNSNNNEIPSTQRSQENNKKNTIIITTNSQHNNILKLPLIQHHNNNQSYLSSTLKQTSSIISNKVSKVSSLQNNGHHKSLLSSSKKSMQLSQFSNSYSNNNMMTKIG